MLEAESCASGTSTEDEGEERMRAEPIIRKSLTFLLAAGVAIMINVSVFVAIRGPLSEGGVGQSLLGPLTVRGLLEGNEFTDLATDNLMAIGQGALESVGRAEVRDHVTRAVHSISGEIRALYPEDHRRLGSLPVNKAQKEAVIRILQKYGDSRMVHLTGAIQDAASETAKVHGDQSALKRKLTEKLAPHFHEMQQLAQEMFPGAHKSFSLDLDGLPVVHTWHPRLEVDLSNPDRDTQALRGRRLSTLAGVDGGVRAQVATMFESLASELGEKMPSAPVRMLTAESAGKEEGLMQCLSEAVSHASPTSVFKCLADNIQDVISMMMKYVKGKAQ